MYRMANIKFKLTAVVLVIWSLLEAIDERNDDINFRLLRSENEYCDTM